MEKNLVKKQAITMIATMLFFVVAFIFTYLSIKIGGIPIIDNNKVVWLSIAFTIYSILSLACVLFFIYDKQTLFRLLVITFACIAFFAVMLFVLCKTKLIVKLQSVNELREAIEKYGDLAAVLFIVFQFLQVVILPIPGSVSVAIGVALFGSWLSFVYSFIGIMAGSIVAFAVGRLIGYKAVEWIVGEEELKKWLHKIKGKDYLLLSLMFLLPLFPDDVLCFIAGLSSMTWGYYVVMITITRLLSVICTSFSFGFIPFNTWWGIVIWVILGMLIAGAFYIVMRYSNQIDSLLKKNLMCIKKQKR